MEVGSGTGAELNSYCREVSLNAPGSPGYGVKFSRAVPDPRRSRRRHAAVGSSSKAKSPLNVNGAVNTPPVNVVGIDREPVHSAAALDVPARLPTPVKVRPSKVAVPPRSI